MSGNNMSRLMIDNKDYDFEDYVFEEEEIYEDVYEYENEWKVRDLIMSLDSARNLAIDMSVYPGRFTKTTQNYEPTHVYIRSECLSFIRNKQHVHFDEFGQPY